MGSWLEQVDDFLQYEGGDLSSAPADHVEYCNRVREWQQSLIPQDFAGRLRGIVGKDIWHHSIREDIHKEESENRRLAHSWRRRLLTCDCSRRILPF